MGNARPIDGRPQSEVQVGPDKLEVVASFCYLGDMLSAGGGCEMAVQGYRLTFFLQEQAGHLKQNDWGPSPKLRGPGFGGKIN